jgi:lactoylglutathione lyase
VPITLTYAIVFVSDMARSVTFYRDVVGLPVKLETSHWTELVTGNATLALHASKTGASPPRDHSAGSCRPGLAVPDLDAFHARMTHHGVTCVQPPKATFGVRIAQYLDPDGLVISISQQQ